MFASYEVATSFPSLTAIKGYDLDKSADVPLMGHLNFFFLKGSPFHDAKFGASLRPSLTYFGVFSIIWIFWLKIWVMRVLRLSNFF